MDASNAFNALNRQVALRNIRSLCPSIATILINTYRAPTDLFVDGSSLLSQEGTTQGDPLAVPMYAVATLPLIHSLPQDVDQVWYADDASASGSTHCLRAWWDEILNKGPAYGYLANSSKTWLITKPKHLASAEAAFLGTNVNITTEGRPHLGAPLGSTDYCAQFVRQKVSNWCTELRTLSSFAVTQPHAAYAVATHGLAGKWNYLARTVPSIGDLLQPLEDNIRTKLIPALTPSKRAPDEHSASLQVTNPLTRLIAEKVQLYTYDACEEQMNAKTDIHSQRPSQQLVSASTLKPTLPSPLQRSMSLAQEKGASSWLTALPVMEFSFTLHKSAFRDALCLRYGWLPDRAPTNCDCGTNFSVEHALSCPKGGFPSIRHNEIRDLTAYLLSEVCNNVCTEPHLQPVTGEQLNGATANSQDRARLLMGSGEAAPSAPFSMSGLKQRIIDLEHSSFTPLVLSSTGGLGPAATFTYKRLATLLAGKWNQSYSSTMSWLRCRLSFSLLRSSGHSRLSPFGGSTHQVRTTAAGPGDS